MKPEATIGSDVDPVTRSPQRFTLGLTIAGLPPFGSLALGSGAVCIGSGLVLLAGYRASHALESILQLETSRPFGWFFRALHAWSALIFLLALVVHVVDFVWRRADRNITLTRWILLVATVPVTVYLMLGGLAITGDAEGEGVAAILRGLLRTVPWVGAPIAQALAGSTGSLQVLCVHHVASASIVLLVLVFIHVRRILPDAVSTGTALGLAGMLALFVRPALGPASEVGQLRGPWFMGGLRWMLQWVPPWLAGVMLPTIALLLFAALPALSDRRARAARWALGIGLAVYGVSTLWAVWR